MLRDLIAGIKNVQNITLKRYNFPLTYVLFLGICVLLWRPKYIERIDVTKWLSDESVYLVLSVFNGVYSHLGSLLIFLSILWFIIVILIEKTSFFSIILPKQKEYRDDSTVMWNEYSALNRIGYIFIGLISYGFIYYLLVNVLFNPYNFSKNFFNVFNSIHSNPIITSGYLSQTNLVLLNIVFIANVIRVIGLLTQVLFKTRNNSDYKSLQFYDEYFFTRINSFSEKNKNNELFETVILKKMYGAPKYFLVNVQLTSNMSLKENHFPEKIEPSKRRYHILDQSENLSDIVYFFDCLQQLVDNNL